MSSPAFSDVISDVISTTSDGLNSADADPTSLWMSADPTEGAKKRTFELMESSSFHNMLNDQPMKLATAAGISVGLLVALLVLFCITALTVIAVLRKLGKEDQIPEAVSYTHLTLPTKRIV